MSDLSVIEKAAFDLLDILSPARRELVRQHLIERGTTMPRPKKPGRRPRTMPVQAVNAAGGQADA